MTGGEAAETMMPVGFNEHIGLKFLQRESGLFVGEIEIAPHHLNRAGIVHGGVYCTMLDTACGGAGLYCPHPGRRRRSVTLSLTTSFTGRCEGGRLVVTGRTVSVGRRIYTSRAEVHDAQGYLVAHGTGTFQFARGSETEFGEPAEAVAAPPAPGPAS